jgi:hypothetical protein
LIGISTPRFADSLSTIKQRTPAELEHARFVQPCAVSDVRRRIPHTRQRTLHQRVLDLLGAPNERGCREFIGWREANGYGMVFIGS